MDDRVEIQVDTGMGTWQTMVNTLNDSQIIKFEMENVKRGHPDWRVRCVDMQGRLVDLLY